MSTVLVSHTVHVTIEATASPISTAFTTGLASRYKPHGVRSRGKVAVPTTALAFCAAAKSSVTNARTTSKVQRAIIRFDLVLAHVPEKWSPIFREGHAQH